MVAAIAMAIVAAPGDMTRDLCDQNGVPPMMIGHLIIGTVVQILTKFHRLIMRRRNQVLTAGELLVRFSNVGTLDVFSHTHTHDRFTALCLGLPR